MHRMARVPILDLAESRTIRDRVHEHSDHWVRRHPQLPFFTLGTASYLDARESGAEIYAQRARETNEILKSGFVALLDQVCSALASVLEEEVSLSPSVAVPGFHVFLSHPGFEKPVADVHFDLQYQWIDWSALGEIFPQTQISFTLPIRLPANGAGLTIWKSDWMEVAGLSPADRAATIRRTTEQSEERYETGVMVIHDGHWLHRISPGRNLGPDDERITLQGHVIRTGSGWIAYW